MNARARLASSADIAPLERESLEGMTRGCDGETADPWEPSMKWPACPAQVALKRPDIQAGLLLRGLAAMSPLANWPGGWTASAVDTWAAIDGERAALREAERHG